jgi:hypothetical protein
MTTKAEERLERAVMSALDDAHQKMRGIAGPREFAAYAAGFRAGWKARNAKPKPKAREVKP